MLAGWTNTLTTANTNLDGTGTVQTVVTGAAAGTFVRSITFMSMGSNVPTVARIFVNNGSTNATPANNCPIDEVTLPQTEVSQVRATPPIVVTVNQIIPNGFKINVAIGTTVAGGWRVFADSTDL